MTPRRIAELIEAAAKRLSPSPSRALDAEALFRGASGMSRAALLSQGDEPVYPDVLARFEAAIARRERHEPIQYILGRTAFWRDEFIVSEAVLIPRADTEVLVEAVAIRLRDLQAPLVLDLGTGSGCIALSLLRELRTARALAVDLSEGALGVAALNAERLGLDARLDLRLSRWFDAVRSTETFDAIVSNPPYVARADEAGLPREVREFEPALALFAEPSDDLSSYRAILAGLDPHLKRSGLLAVEVGVGQSDRVADLVKTGGLQSIEILNDLAGIPRVVLGRRS